MDDSSFSWSIPTLALLAGMAILAGCATSGVIPARTEGRTVHFRYHHGFFEQGGTIDVTMPDGEVFTGKFVPGQTDSSGLAFPVHAKDPILTSSHGDTTLITAVLLGDKGDSMHCQFQVQAPGGGLESGGVGRCKLSDDEVIDASF